MNPLTRIYDAIASYARKQIVEVMVPVALSTANVSARPLEERIEIHPIDPDSPCYRRQRELDRFNGIRDMELQMNACSSAYK
jgi:hypothetical protein